MPKTKTRTRRRPSSAPRRPAARIDLVSQRSMAMLVNDLDDVLRAVPAVVDLDNITEVVEHHHRTTEVVNFLHARGVVDTLARLAGGSMMVMPDADAPADVEAEAVGNYTEPDPTQVLTDDPPNGTTLPRRTPGAAVDPSGRTVAAALPDQRPARELAAVGAGFVARIQSRVPATVQGRHGRAICPICEREMALTATRRLVWHGPRKAPCAGRGLYISPDSPFGPITEVAAP